MKLEQQVGIYCIRNKINGKRYIGQSVRLSERINYHLNRAPWNDKSDEYNTPIHKSIRKYGLANFEVDILEYCTRACLDEREIYWISYYNTYPLSKNKGYNQTAGGNNCSTTSDFLYPRLDEITELLKYSDYTQVEIAKIVGSSVGMIQMINTGRSWYRDSIDYPIRKFHLHKTKDGAHVKYANKDSLTYECISCGTSISKNRKYCDSCFTAYNKRAKRICPSDFAEKVKILKTKTALCKHYNTGNLLINRWLSESNINLNDLNKKATKVKKKPHAKKVAKYLNLTDVEPVATYDSIYAASKSTGVRSPSMITNACNNQTIYKEHYWRYI